jgi:NAD(P)H-nitrite reductase large subunit
MWRGHLLLHQDGECGCGCGCGGGSSADEALLSEWREAPDDRLVCHCAKVDKNTIVGVIRSGAFTAPLVKIITGIGRGRPCPRKHHCLEILDVLLKIYGQTTLADALAPLEEKKEHQ